MCGSKAQLPWEDNIVLIGAFLSELSHVRETHCLNIVGRCGKAGTKRYKSDVYWIGNVVAEVIGEPV